MPRILWRSKSPPEPRLDVEGIYLSKGRWIWAVLHRLGVKESDLPDVMQEILVVVHRRLPSYDGSGRLEPWLFGICAKVVANYRRRAFRRHERVTADLDPIESQDPEALNSMRDDRAALNAVLERVDPLKRAVLLMFEVEGMSCQQIADDLSIPLGTVHSRLHGARQEFSVACQKLRMSRATGSSTPVRRFGT